MLLGQKAVPIARDRERKVGNNEDMQEELNLLEAVVISAKGNAS